MSATDIGSTWSVQAAGMRQPVKPFSEEQVAHLQRMLGAFRPSHDRVTGEGNSDGRHIEASGYNGGGERK